MPADPSAGASPRRTPIDSRPVAPTRDTLDDAEVVRSVLDGDRDAFRILVDRESARGGPRLLPRPRRPVRGRRCRPGSIRDRVPLARDVALRRPVRCLADAHRGSPRRPPARSPARGLLAAPARWHRRRGASHLAARPTSERSPSTWPSRAERAAATRRAVADLGEPYREVVALRFFGERSLDEIAILTGRPLSTVKTHLRRGLLRLARTRSTRESRRDRPAIIRFRRARARIARRAFDARSRRRWLDEAVDRGARLPERRLRRPGHGGPRQRAGTVDGRLPRAAPQVRPLRRVRGERPAGLGIAR